MADSLFNLQVKRILARSTHHQLSMQIEAAAMPRSLPFALVRSSILLPHRFAFATFSSSSSSTSSSTSSSFFCCGCNLNPQKWCQFLLALPFQNSKAQSEWLLDATLGQLKGEWGGGGTDTRVAPLMPNGSCFCPAVCHLAKTFGQHLRRSRKKTFAASVRSAHTNQRGTVAREGRRGSGSGVRHVEHACTTDTRAHVPHLFDGNLHALDSHQRQTVSASATPLPLPTPVLFLPLQHILPLVFLSP